MIEVCKHLLFKDGKFLWNEYTARFQSLIFGVEVPKNWEFCPICGKKFRQLVKLIQQGNRSGHNYDYEIDLL